MAAFGDSASVFSFVGNFVGIHRLYCVSTVLFYSSALKLFSSATQRMLSNTIFNWIQIRGIADKCFNYLNKLTKCKRANC